MDATQEILQLCKDFNDQLKQASNIREQIHSALEEYNIDIHDFESQSIDLQAMLCQDFYGSNIYDIERLQEYLVEQDLEGEYYDEK